MAKVRIITARAPGLIPVLAREVDRARKPVVLVPESFTLACETEIVSRSRDGGFFGLPVFSPSSLVREIASFGGDISALVPPEICQEICDHYRRT